MVDSPNDTAPDPEELAEEEGGSGMPMTAAEIVAAGDDEDEDTDADDLDDEDDDLDEDADDEANDPAETQA